MPHPPRPVGYWLLQAFFILSVPLMSVGQTMSLINYEWTVSVGLQESVDEVSLFGAQLNKAFGFADTVVFVPLLIASSIGLRRRASWALAIAGATLGVSTYWSVEVAALFFLLPEAPGYNYTPGPGVIAFVSGYAIVGVLGLVYLWRSGTELTRLSIRNDAVVRSPSPNDLPKPNEG